VLYDRSRYIILHEGPRAFVSQSLVFFKDLFFQNGIYFVYEINLDSSKATVEPNSRTDFILKVISNLKEYDQLIIEGYNLKKYHFQPLIAKGGIAFCLFANKCLIYQGWIGTTENIKQEFDMVPYKVNFNSGEVCIGGIFCDPEYRGKRLHTYVLSKCIQYGSQIEAKKIKYSIKKGNVASIKSFEKYNHKVLSQWHHFKILWWSSWKETPYDKEDKSDNIIDSVAGMGTKFFLKTPTALKFIFLPIITFKSCLNVRIDQWILTGKAINSEDGMELLYSGSKQNKNYLAGLVFGGSYEEKYIGKKWLWNLFSLKKQSGCAMSITDIPKPFKSLFSDRNSFIIPSWIDGGIKLPDDLSKFVHKNRTLVYNLNQIKKHKYYYEVTRNHSQFANFYHSMYLPYVKASYSEQALVSKFKELKPKFENYELLYVKKEGENLAGALIYCSPNEVILDYLGVQDGNINYVREGAQAALYYFSFCYLQERGFKNVKLGGTRAFLKDGVLSYKKKWDLNIRVASQVVFLLRILSITHGVKEFLMNNPFIFVDNRRFNGAYFVAGDESTSENEIKSTLKKYQVKGMDKFFIFRLKGEDISLWKTVDLPISEQLDNTRTDSQHN
jgi:hypothetical protein